MCAVHETYICVYVCVLVQATRACTLYMKHVTAIMCMCHTQVECPKGLQGGESAEIYGWCSPCGSGTFKGAAGLLI